MKEGREEGEKEVEEQRREGERDIENRKEVRKRVECTCPYGMRGNANKAGRVTFIYGCRGCK